ncbi:MAG: D-2-hydroxyacid dehydrogenase [Candidatus Latescibacteria bacterium]|nr:D-2-hydroxyacid dehydrogenase [Candidatus Latescibacterota bacterium]
MRIMIHFPFDEDQIEAFRTLAAQYGDHEVVHVANEEEALPLAAETDILLGHFPAAICAVASQLRWIQSFSAGMDNFLFPEIVARHDVVVTNMAGLYAPQGGEHAWALLLALARGLHTSVAAMTAGKWGRGAPVVELTGATLGIVGLGGFGLETLKRAQGYDMQVLALDPVRTQAPTGVDELKKPSRDNLHALLGRADAVVIACPRTPQTYHLIGAAELAAMKESAYLVNVTRGGIIDETALLEALQQGQIAGAGLDVTETEPLPADDPLWQAPNLILTPHRAGASQHRPRKTFEFFHDNLGRYLRGEEVLNVVDKQRGF